MKLLNDGEIYDYIDSKTARLQKHRKHGMFRMVTIWLVAVALWAAAVISGGEAIIIGLLGSAWGTLSYALCNIHVDTLHVLDWRMKRGCGFVTDQAGEK